MVFASCGGGDSEITLSEEATQLIDDWMEGWQAGDPAAVAALFSEGGVRICLMQRDRRPFLFYSFWAES